MIDLARRFLGKFTDVRAKLRTFFWSADVENNRFVACNIRRQVAFFAYNLDRVEEPVHI